MAKDTIVLSPITNAVKSEALADAAIEPGALLEYTATGVDLFGTAAAVAEARPLMLFATENISVAGDVDTAYADGDNVFAAAVPSGTLVNVRAVDATYSPGDLLETALAGELQALTTGAAVAVVPSFGGEVITGGLLLVQII